MLARIIAAAAAIASAGLAIWYLTQHPLPKEAARVAPASSSAPGGKSAVNTAQTPAPKELRALAAWLKEVPLVQRGPIVREQVLSLSLAKAADREQIRAFLLSGADVEIERPGTGAFDAGDDLTTLRRLLLGMLEDFPAAEAVPLARSILATAKDFRETHLCLRALEHQQPDGNRPDALAAMQRILPAAAKPAGGGEARQQYLAQYDRLAEPIAHYQLAELHPVAMQAVAANPFLAGRYTQAVESYPPADLERALTDLFANAEVAQELTSSNGTRSVNVWLDPGYRARVAQVFSTRMNDVQRRSLLFSLSEDTGLHFSAKPLAEPKQPALQPIDSAAETARAKARLAMLDTLAPQAAKPELKSALEESRDAVNEEIKSVAETLKGPRLTPVELPNLNPLGSPASTLAPLPGEETAEKVKSGGK